MEGHVLTCRASFSSLVRCTPSSTLAPRAVKATAAMSSLYRRLVTRCRSQDSWGEISVNALKIESSFKKYIYIYSYGDATSDAKLYIYESSTLQIHRMPTYPPDLAGFWLHRYLTDKLLFHLHLFLRVPLTAWGVMWPDSCGARFSRCALTAKPTKVRLEGDRRWF